MRRRMRTRPALQTSLHGQFFGNIFTPKKNFQIRCFFGSGQRKIVGTIIPRNSQSSLYCFSFSALLILVGCLGFHGEKFRTNFPRLTRNQKATFAKKCLNFVNLVFLVSHLSRTCLTPVSHLSRMSRACLAPVSHLSRTCLALVFLPFARPSPKKIVSAPWLNFLPPCQKDSLVKVFFCALKLASFSHNVSQKLWP